MAWYKCSGGGEGIPLITKSGSIVTYEDSVGGVPINDLVADITPIQAGSGDPSPSNIRPFIGFTGVNVMRCGKNMISDIQQGGIDATTGTETVSATRVRTGFIKVTPNTTYTVAVNSSSDSLVNFHILEYEQTNASSYIGSSNVTIATKTFTTRANTNFVRITARDTTNVDITPSDLSKWQLEIGSSATAFEPFNGTTYSVSWQTEAGEIVEGTINIVSGLLTVEHMKQVYRGDDLDTLSLSYGQAASGYTHMYFGINNIPLGQNYGQQLHTKSNMGVLTNAQSGSIPSSEGFAVLNITNPDRLIVYWYVNLTWASANDFKTWLNNNPFELYYQLATPQTYQLTPTEVAMILGTNYISADTGDIDVKFYKPVTNLDTLVEQTKNLAPDLLALASAGNGTSTREAFDMTDDTIGTKATRIPDYMFYKNLNVEKVNLSTVESVGSNTFYMCPYIKEINLPNTTELKSSAFNASSRSLTSPTPMVINLPSCTNIADSALREMGYAGTPCTITLTECETLQGNAIRGASARYFTIDTLNLPSIKTIGQECLDYHRITTVDIGANCTSIASKPFNGGTVGTLIIRATTPPSLNSGGLGCTPTKIKVPSESVETYKTASSWSTYESIIEAI